MLTILSIAGENFKSFKSFNFTIQEGLWVVKGNNKDESLASSNGSGKTTLFCDSIFWCLTGKSIEGLDAADDIVNFKTKKDCLVEVNLLIDNKKVKIKRARKHSIFKNNLFLEVDDQDLTAHRVDDTQARINQLIKINSDLLKSTIIMTADMKSRFSDLTPKDRISLLESIRDYKVWDRFRDETKVSLDDYNTKISDLTATNLIKSGEISKSQQIINELESSLTQTEDLSEVESQLRLKIDELNAYNLDENNSDQINQLKQIVSDIDNQVSDIEKKNRELNEKTNSFYSKTSRLESSIKDSQREISLATTLLTETGECPTCGQKLKLSEEKKQQIFDNLTYYKKQLIESTKELEETKESFSALQQMSTVDTSSLRKKKDVIQSQINALSEEDLNKKYAVKSLKESIEYLQNKIDSSKKKLEESKTLIETYKSQLEELIKCVNENESQIKNLNVEKSRYQFFYDSLGPKGTLRPYLLSKDVLYLNKCLQYYSSRLFGDTKISLTTPTLDSNKIDIVFENANGLIKPVSVLSRGERKRLDLCIQFALYDLIRSTAMFDINLLVLDEIFESLDVTGIGQVISILQERSENIPSIYVISHNPNAYDLIQRQIIVTKTNDTSKVVFDKKAEKKNETTE